jgi:hypothetical protein
MEAEYAALSEVSREIVYIKRLLAHMGFHRYVKSPINVYCDNQSAIELSKNAMFHKRSKHVLSVDIKNWDKHDTCIKSKITNLHRINLAFYNKVIKIMTCCQKHQVKVQFFNDNFYFE